MKEKITSLKVYEAVKFEGRMSKFFTTIKTQSHPACTIELLEGIGAKIYTDSDAIIVPYPNISGIHLDTDIKSEKREARKEDISKPAKAQNVSKLKTDPVGAKRL